VAVALVAGCGASVRVGTATTTVTATVTATTTATAAASPTVVRPAPASVGTAMSSAVAPARLRLSVFDDGCGVVRSESPPGAYQALTWVFRDSDGFQVLGRNAEGESRYRYYRSGTYTVALEAFAEGRYVPVSNAVTVRC